MNTQSRNAQEAIAEANRFDRARQIIEEGYTFTQDTLTNMIAVCKPNELHASYWIGEHVDGSTGCDCPDKARRKKPCKHEMAWDMLQAERADEAAMWEAICNQWEEEEGESKPSSPSTTAQFLEAVQARMCSDLNKARELASVYKIGTKDLRAERVHQLETALLVIGEYWGKELCGRLDLQPAPSEL